MERQNGNGDHAAAPGVAVLDAAARRLAAFHRISWREALGSVATAAGRLHRYRDLRTRMLHDALRLRDCGQQTSDNDNGE